MSGAARRISEWRDVDEATFRNEIAVQYAPAVLRGLVARWPAVKHAQTLVESIHRYLCGLDSGAAVDVLMMPPHVHGRLFYNDDMSGFNFSRIKASIGDVSDKLIRYAKFDNRPSLAAQSALIAVTAMSHGFISSGADAASIAQLFSAHHSRASAA